MISLATASDLDAIAALNVEAYREFADRMTPDGWQKMEASIRSIEARTRSTRFLVTRDQGAIVGSVGYCPTGKGNPKIFAQDWATVLVLAVERYRCHEQLFGIEQITQCLASRLASTNPSMNTHQF